MSHNSSAQWLHVARDIVSVSKDTEHFHYHKKFYSVPSNALIKVEIAALEFTDHLKKI